MMIAAPTDSQIYFIYVIIIFTVSSQLYDVYASPIKGDWSRKDFKLKDQSGDIRTKLWDDMGLLIGPGCVGKIVLVKNIVLDRYGGNISVGSTPETIIEVRVIFFGMVYCVHSYYLTLNPFLSQKRILSRTCPQLQV